VKDVNSIWASRTIAGSDEKSTVADIATYLQLDVKELESAMQYSITVSLLLCLATTTSSYSESIPTPADVEHLCLRPSEAKTHLRVDGDGKANSGLIIRLVGLHLSGSAHFSKEEWNGVQAALPAADVARDSADYRKCVEQLAPIFISKYEARPSRSAPHVQDGRTEIRVDGSYNPSTIIVGGSGNQVSNSIGKK
jgi:hypothetical protein